MGNNQSQEATSVLTVFNETNNTTITSIYNESVSDCVASNELTILTGQTRSGAACLFVSEGGIDVNQKASSNCSLTSSNLNSITTQMVNQVKNNVETVIKQNAEAENSFFSTAFSNQVQSVTNETEVINVLNNYIENNIVNTCENFTFSGNGTNMYLCGIFGESINVNQDASTLALTSCINKTIVDAFTNNDILNDLLLKTEAVLKSKNEGIGDAFKDFFSGLSTPFLIGGIAIAVIIILIIIGLIIFAVVRSNKKKSKEPTSTPNLSGKNTTATTPTTESIESTSTTESTTPTLSGKNTASTTPTTSTTTPTTETTPLITPTTEST